MMSETEREQYYERLVATLDLCRGNMLWEILTIIDEIYQFGYDKAIEKVASPDNG